MFACKLRRIIIHFNWFIHTSKLQTFLLNLFKIDEVWNSHQNILLQLKHFGMYCLINRETYILFSVLVNEVFCIWFDLFCNSMSASFYSIVRPRWWRSEFVRSSRMRKVWCSNPLCSMAMRAEYASKFAALHRQWWCLYMSEKFSSGTKTPEKANNDHMLTESDIY